MKQSTQPVTRHSSALAASGNGPAAQPTLVDTTTSRPAGRVPDLLDSLAQPRLAVPMLCVLGAMVFILNLGGYPLYTKGEPREAVTVLDIFRGAGVILPMRAGVEIPSKPLLMHWLAALLSLASGRVNEWTVRLPSAICAMLGVIICYQYVRKLFSPRAGLIAALILATTSQYLQAGTGARVDMTLTFFLELGLFEFIVIAEGLRKATAPLYLALACAVLTKGPVGIALPILIAAIWMLVWKRTDVLHKLRIWQGVLIVGGIAGGWYVAAIAVGGFDFVHKQLLVENLYRLFGAGGVNEGHAHHFYYVEGALIAGFMPWSPLAAAALLQYWWPPRRLDWRLGYLLVWMLTVLVFYNLPQSKRGVYLLAFYPALSAITAILLVEALDAPGRIIERAVPLLSLAAGTGCVIAGAVGIIGCAVVYKEPALLQAILAPIGITIAELPAGLRAGLSNHWLATVMLPLIAIVTGALVLHLPLPNETSVRLRVLAGRMVGGTVVAMAAIILAINLIVEPAVADALSPTQFARRVSEMAGRLPIYYFGSLDYAFIFYSGGDVKLVSKHDSPELMVGRAEQWPLMPANLRTNYQVVLRSHPTDLDGSGQLLLLRRIDRAR